MTPAEIEKVFDWYSADQPQNATFQREIHRWSTFCQDLKDKPSSLLVAFILADSDYYPNIHEIFHKNSTNHANRIRTMWTNFFCFEASKAMEQNSNGRVQTKRTNIIAHSEN